MVDRISSSARSANMKRIRSKNTLPERKVRSIVHGMGYRYGLHCKDLPGSPDLVFRCRKKVIFVHGCFWHRHEGCLKAQTPQTNIEYWKPKLQRNADRDAENRKELKNLGWKCLTIWECQIRDEARLKLKIKKFLE